MPSTFTTAKQLELVARGEQVGTWDTPENSNWSVVDSALGGSVSISLNNSPVVLASNQYQQCQIVFISTLTGNVSITFPTSFTGPYLVSNTCTGSSAFVITLQTTAAGGQVICAPPGDSVDVFNDGTNIKFKNFDRIGSYWDYAGSSVPAWVTGCTVPPYLNCNGTTFSSATYPTLAAILGGTTLPDAAGRFRATLNQGTNRITSGSSTGGVDGNTAFAAGGSQTVTLSSQNIPPVPLVDPTHAHAVHATQFTVTVPGGAFGFSAIGSTLATNIGNTDSVATGITAGSTTPTNYSNLPPTYIGGITMIRAA